MAFRAMTLRTSTACHSIHIVLMMPIRLLGLRVAGRLQSTVSIGGYQMFSSMPRVRPVFKLTSLVGLQRNNTGDPGSKSELLGLIRSMADSQAGKMEARRPATALPLNAVVASSEWANIFARRPPIPFRLNPIPHLQDGTAAGWPRLRRHDRPGLADATIPKVEDGERMRTQARISSIQPCSRRSAPCWISKKTGWHAVRT